MGYLPNNTLIFYQLLHYFLQIIEGNTLFLSIILHKEFLDLIFLPFIKFILSILPKRVLIFLFFAGSRDAIITFKLKKLTGTFLGIQFLVLKAIINLGMFTVKVCFTLRKPIAFSGKLWAFINNFSCFFSTLGQIVLTFRNLFCFYSLSNGHNMPI